MNTKSIVALVLALSGGLVVVLIGLCAGFLLYTFRTMDAEISPLVDELFVAIENDNLAETYDTHLTPEFQKVTTRDQYLQLGQMIKTNLGELKSKKLARFNVQQRNASRYADIVYSGTFEKGAGTVTVKLRKVGDKWLLVGFNVNSPEFTKSLATAKCPHCGEPHKAGAKYCSKCGKPLAASEEKAKPAEEASPAEIPSP
jgi:hypothetical protein